MSSIFINPSKQLTFAQAYATFRSLCWAVSGEETDEVERLKDAANVALKAYEKEESYSNWVSFEAAASKFWESAKRG